MGKTSQRTEKTLAFFGDKKEVFWIGPWERDLLKEAAQELMKPVIIVVSETGMLLEEFISLTWFQVDFKNRFIFIPASGAKGGKDRRIPLSDLAYDTLKKHEEKYRLGSQ